LAPDRRPQPHTEAPTLDEIRTRQTGRRTQPTPTGAEWHVVACAPCGRWHRAKEVGKLRVEGEDYVAQDGDVMEFRFNV
jgi:hypothetical protein